MVFYRKKNMKQIKYRKSNKYTKKVPTEIKKYVKRHTPKAEVKRELDGFSENIVSATVTPYLNFEPLIAQGTQYNQRVGNQIKMTGIYIRTMIHNNSTLTQMVRCVVLSCPSDTDTAPATMELFKDLTTTGATGGILTSGTSFGNCLYRLNDNKFKVHWDHLVKLGNVNSGDAKNVVFLKKFIRLNSIIKYDGNTTGLGNQTRRFLILYLTSDPALDSSGGGIELTGNHFYYFVDV